MPLRRDLPWLTLQNGRLHLESCDLVSAASLTGSPAFLYSHQALHQAITAYKTALADIGSYRLHYAAKANSTHAILTELVQCGLGLDIVSAGEMRCGLQAGFHGEDMVFSGAGKTEAELAAALEAGLYQINIESESELERLSALATQRGMVQNIALRVNPDISLGGHDKISTGRGQDKFGLPLADIPRLYARAANLPGLNPVGLALHLGSQILDMQAFAPAFRMMASLTMDLRHAGYKVQRLDLGGGIGVPYHPQDPAPDLTAYAALIREIITPLEVHLLLEPGRSLVAAAGLLLARIIHIKPGNERPIVILDTGMTELLRVSLYDAWHEIYPIQPRAGAEIACDLHGPLCESGDRLAQNRRLPTLEIGDVLAILDTGAYAASMSLLYNARDLAPAFFVKKDEICPVRDKIGLEVWRHFEHNATWQTVSAETE